MSGDKANSFLKFAYRKIDNIKKYILLSNIRKEGMERIVISSKLIKYDFNKKDDIIAIIIKDII